MTSIPEQKALDAPHKITLDARSRLSVTGVLEIESFDDGMIAPRHNARGRSSSTVRVCTCKS